MGGIEILDRLNHGKPGRAGGVGVDHADGIGDMIRDPDLFAVGPDGDAHGIDADMNAGGDLEGGRFDHVHRICRGIGHINKPT